MNNFLKISLLVLLVTSCNTKTNVSYRALKANNNLHTINLSKIAEKEELSIDSVFYEPRYITLETTNQSLISEISKMIVRNDTIYIMDASKVQQTIFAFNIKGKFLYRINARGQGPGEYSKIHDFYVDNDNKQIGILSFSEIYKYDFNGKFIEKLKLRKHYLTEVTYSSGYIYGRKDAYSGFSGKVYAIKVFDPQGNLIYDDYPEDKNIMNSPIKNGRSKTHLTIYNDKVFFHPFYNDTIYEIQKDNIKLFLNVDFGKYKISPKEMNTILQQSEESQRKKYLKLVNSTQYVSFGITNLVMGDNYLWLEFPKSSLYGCFYSLKSQKIKLYNTWNRNSKNFFFTPRIFMAVKGKDFYSYIASNDIMTMKKLYNDPKKRKQIFSNLSDKQIAWVEKYMVNYTLEDNPIIMVFSLKDF